MNIFYDISEILKDPKTVLTIGTFDGFHKGHQKIISQLVNDAQSAFGGRSILITFEPHPRSVLSKDYDLKLLTTPEEKLELIEASGLENVLVINFTPEFSKLSPEEFIEGYIINRIGLNELVMGYDNHFGRNREGDEQKIRQLAERFGFNVVHVDAVTVNDESVSSTKIRQALNSGDMDKANEYLGRVYSFSGKVVKGAMRGRTLGFPTANIKLHNKQKLIPSRGVYLVELSLAQENFYGIMNIGLRPTFGDVFEMVIEVFIFNFEREIYDSNVRVKVLKRIRDEKKFSSKEDLVEQLKLDRTNALEIIKTLNN